MNLTNVEVTSYLTFKPILAITYIVVLCLASGVGTFGNILVIYVIATKNIIKGAEATFIVNLALSDLYVTAVANPISVLAKVEGEHYIDNIPGLCVIAASICTVTCVSSLTTIMMMSVNRYVYICAPRFRHIFTTRNAVLYCLLMYCFGIALCVLNRFGVGAHGFDKKGHMCIWDRMATHHYTIVYSVVMVWIPALVTGVIFLRVFWFVRKTTRAIFPGTTLARAPQSPKHIHVAKSFIIIYLVFITCWAPYALIMIIDNNDTYPEDLHVFITVFAHLHASLSWIVYYATNKHFNTAYRNMLASCK